MAKKNINKLGIILLFSMMFLTPFIENTRGIFIPIFKLDFTVTNTMISTAIFVSSIIGLGVSLYGGIVIEKIGQKKTLMAAATLIGLGISMQIITDRFSLFFLGFIPITMGINLYNVSVNTIIPIIFIGSKTIAMNLLHFMFGAGSSVSQNLVGTFLDKSYTWKQMYGVLFMVYFIVIIIFSFAKIPDTPVEQSVTSKKNGVFKEPLIYAFGLALGFYAFAEMGISLWLTNYLKETYGFRESIGARYLGIFFLLFAIGRLLGGFIVQKKGVFKSVLFSLSVSLILLLGGILLGQNYIIIISISGLFFSIVFPSIMSFVSNVFTERPAYATGIILAFVSIGINGMNFLMGVLTDIIGAKLSIFLIPASLLISIMFVIYIKNHDKVKNFKGVIHEKNN